MYCGTNIRIDFIASIGAGVIERTAYVSGQESGFGVKKAFLGEYGSILSCKNKTSHEEREREREREQA